MPFISGVKCERCGRTSYYKSIRTKKEIRLEHWERN